MRVGYNTLNDTGQIYNGILPPWTHAPDLSDDTSVNNTVPTPLSPLYTSLEIMIALAAIIGNALVILLFYKFSFMRTVTNVYVISLAMADLLVGLVGIPCAIAVSVGLPKNFQACLIMSTLLLLLCTASIFSLVGVTIDRLWAILYPLRYSSVMTHRRARYVISVVWVLATIVGLLPSFGWNRGEPEVPSCYFMDVMDLRYLVFIYFATIVAPSLFMFCVYVRIYQEVRSQLRHLTQTKVVLTPVGESSVTHSQLKTQTQAAQGIAVIVLLFVVSWLPLYTINTILYFRPTTHVPPWVFLFTIILSHLNSAWNPLLYAWGMRDYRRALRKLLGINRDSMLFHSNGVLSYSRSSAV